MKVGIIGCGAIGNKRATVLSSTGDVLVAAFDVVSDKARQLVDKHDCLQHAVICDTVDELLAEVDVAVVATTHDALVPAAMQAVKRGLPVLVEKPAGIDHYQAQTLAVAAHQHNTVVKVGFNHRFHPAAQRAKRLLESGELGDVMFVRGRYGHGGRPGYDKEWRAIPQLSGGGELLDQGIHLIDLARWFVGDDFIDVQGRVETYFWDMPVDDNAFMTLATARRQVAHLQVSWTEWKNTFSVEVYCRYAKLHLEGLGGSYGVERLYHYQMTPALGPPDALIYEYPSADPSWEAEWRDFKRAVETGSRPCGDINDAVEALRVVDRIYGR